MAKKPVPQWKRRRRRKEIISKGLAHLVLLAGSIVFAFPFLWLVSTSLKEDTQIFVFPPQLIPDPIRWRNYPDMLEYIPFFRFLANTTYVTAISLVGTLVSCSLVAYSFSRLRWRGRDFCFKLMLSTMMLPYQVRMIPLYLTFRNIGWIDTLRPLWIQSWFGVPYSIFLLRQFYLTIPVELEDAAKIDGCSYFGIYSKIMLPLIKPALAVVGIFTFQGQWNQFTEPLIYINSIENMTISLGLRLFQQEHASEWSLLMAASTLAILPIVLLFFFGQKYFIQGVVLTGIKG